MEKRGGRPRIAPREGISCIDDYWTLHRDVHNPCSMMWYGKHQSRSLEKHIRRVARPPCVVGRSQKSQIVGNGSYLGDDGAGASSNGGGDDADGGESVGLARKLLLVT
jgi:hypothetical protein